LPQGRVSSYWKEESVKTYVVMRMPRSKTWGVYEISTGYYRLVEGGFFSKAVAEKCRDLYESGEAGGEAAW
jgi:hypothetical protein